MTATARAVNVTALQELVDRGVGFDMNPTMLFDSAESVYSQWLRYAARIDAAWRSRVAEALNEGTVPEVQHRKEDAR